MHILILLAIWLSRYLNFLWYNRCPGRGSYFLLHLFLNLISNSNILRSPILIHYLISIFRRIRTAAAAFRTMSLNGSFLNVKKLRRSIIFYRHFRRFKCGFSYVWWFQSTFSLLIVFFAFLWRNLLISWWGWA